MASRVPSFALGLLCAAALAGCVDEAALAPSAETRDPLQPASPDAPGAPSPGAANGTAAPPFAPGWPPLDAAVVRPGVKLYDPLPTQLARGDYAACTASFVFSSPDNRTLYLGTASHCVSGHAIGDPVPVAMGKARGFVAYCSFGTIEGTEACPDKGVTSGIPNDFALIRIDDADRGKVHPATLGFGGPTGLADAVQVGAPALTYGNTDMRDLRQEALPDALDGRAGRVHETSEWTTSVAFDLSGLPGDSGSPALLADGRALGVVKTLQITGCAGGRVDVMGVVNLSRALRFLEEETGLRVELETWPLLATSSPVGPPACS